MRADGGDEIHRERTRGDRAGAISLCTVVTTPHVQAQGAQSEGSASTLLGHENDAEIRRKTWDVLPFVMTRGALESVRCRTMRQGRAAWKGTIWQRAITS